MVIPNNLAIAILTLNEENDLAKCLLSLKGLKADIFVFDSGSTDLTSLVAKSYGANVVTFHWNGKYPKKKQWALNYLKANYKWVLLLDADESLTSELFQAVESAISEESGHAAYDVDLLYWFCNRPLKHGMKFSKRILMQPSQVMFPEIDDLGVKHMWEVEGHYQPIATSGSIGKLKGNLSHHDTDSIFDFLHRHNRYSDWEAFVLSRQSVRKQVFAARPTRARTLSQMPFKGTLVFIYSYIFKLGFLDGRPGFNFAVNQAFYYWQIELKIRSLTDE